MTEIKHTPLPWQADYFKNIWGCGSKIAEFSSRPPQAECYREVGASEHKANADFIVLCVNSHYDLVAALKRYRNSVNDHVLAEYADAALAKAGV